MPTGNKLIYLIGFFIEYYKLSVKGIHQCDLVLISITRN